MVTYNFVIRDLWPPVIFLFLVIIFIFYYVWSSYSLLGVSKKLVIREYLKISCVISHVSFMVYICV